MFVVLRNGIAAKAPCSGIAKELCKILHKNNVSKYQAATLTRAAFRNEDDFPNIKPFPYHNKQYNTLNMILDSKICRVNENSKIIVIDGPPAAGKHKLGKELAKEFDFLFLPNPTFDDLYINQWGFDARTLDDQLPKDVQTWDIERFLQDPTDWNTAAMQNYMLYMREKLYINALAHILLTGQGVVTIRSPWSDMVFAKAMAKNKYISPEAFESHTDSCLASLHWYLRPHLVVYLDVPVNITQQNIKKRGLPHEVNAKALTDQYLSDLEESYKTDYLSKIAEHSLLLVYDWSQGGDSEVVLEDIENLNFDNRDEHESIVQDWRWSTHQWKTYAKLYTRHAQTLLYHGDIMRTDCPEMLVSGNDRQTWVNLINKIPDTQYEYGYNPLKGDKNIMWNTKDNMFPDNVTPLMQKYYERKQREKQK